MAHDWDTILLLIYVPLFFFLVISIVNLFPRWYGVKLLLLFMNCPFTGWILIFSYSRCHLPTLYIGMEYMRTRSFKLAEQVSCSQNMFKFSFLVFALVRIWNKLQILRDLYFFYYYNNFDDFFLVYSILVSSLWCTNLELRAQICIFPQVWVFLNVNWKIYKETFLTLHVSRNKFCK